MRVHVFNCVIYLLCNELILNLAVWINNIYYFSLSASGIQVPVRDACDSGSFKKLQWSSWSRLWLSQGSNWEDPFARSIIWLLATLRFTGSWPETSASWHQISPYSYPACPRMRTPREKKRVSHNLFLINLQSDNAFVIFYSLRVSRLV